MQKRIHALVLLSLVLCACSKDTIPETTQVEPDTMGSSEIQEGAEPVSYGGTVECRSILSIIILSILHSSNM